ncbi:reverse transcriptase domain-containing protein [Tanacetum coccineum]
MEPSSEDWEEKSKAFLYTQIAVAKVPVQMELGSPQGDITIKRCRLEELMTTHITMKAGEVTGNQNQQGIGPAPRTMTSPSHGYARKKIPSHLESGILISQRRECLAMSRHMTEVWFEKLPKEFVDSYEDLRAAFQENYLPQTKHIKDPVEIHHIKQRDGESTEDFTERYKAESLDVEGAPECMKISGFMHGITHPGLIKRLYEKIPRSMDEMFRATTSFP